MDDTNKEYEYHNVESFDPTNNAFKKAKPHLQNPEQNYKVEDQYYEYGQEDKWMISNDPTSKYENGKKNRQMISNIPSSKQSLCNPNDEALILIRKLNGDTHITNSLIQNCDDKKMRAIDLIRAINGGGSHNQYQSNNGNGILSNLFNFARNLPRINI